MRLAWVGVVAVVVLSLAGLVWHFVFLGNPLGTILAPPPSEPSTPDWDTPSDIDVTSVPLADAVARLARRHGLPIRIDTSSLRQLGLNGSERVTLRIRGVTLRSTLEHLARGVSNELCVVSQGGVITITTREEQQLASRFVDLRQWREPDAAIVRRVTEMLRTLTAVDGERAGQFLSLLRGWPIPADDIDWIEMRATDERLNRRQEYARLLKLPDE